MKKIISVLFLISTIMLFSQQKNVNVDTELGHPPDCKGYQGICAFHLSNNKSKKDTQLSYQPKTGELLIKLDKQKLGKENTDKLLTEQRTKGKMQYRFTYDNPLPPDVVQQLGLKGKVYIKKGVYPIIVTKEAYLLRVTLVFK